MTVLDRLAVLPIEFHFRRLFLFCTFNSLFFWLMNLKILFNFFPLELADTHGFAKCLIAIYIVSTYFSFFGLLPFLILIPALVFSFLYRLTKVYSLILIMLMSLFAIFLFWDGILFALYRFHLNSTLVSFFLSKDSYEFFAFSTTEWVIILSIGLAIFFIEIGIAYLSNRLIKINPTITRKCRVLVKIEVVLLFFSYLTLLLSMGYGISGFSQQAKAFPLYQTALLSVTPIEASQLEQFANGRYIQLKDPTGNLHYPAHPLKCKGPIQPYNLLFIGIDSWRFDQLKSDVTPHLVEFAKHNSSFAFHYSGGNNTRSGLFSLFYGLPGTYWTSMLEHHQRPLLLDELNKQHYRFGVFFSGELTTPPFDKTIFTGIESLQKNTLGDTPVARDKQITQDFGQFIHQSNQPFFSFLFYVAPQSYCIDQPLPNRFSPSLGSCVRMARNNQTDPIPYFNRYRNALYHVDQQIQEVLELLKSENLYNNTVIVLTSDHGQEFNDNHRNYWEHAGNYTRYQMQVPLIVHWPGKSVQRFTHQTSHYDISTSLLEDFMRCENPSTDYSFGPGLFNTDPRPFLIGTSYVNYAIIESNQMTVLQTNGEIEVQDTTAKPLPPSQIHWPILHKALKELRRFFG